MKLTKQIKAGLVVELEENKQIDLFESLASAEEVFGEAECGKCKGQIFKHIIRTNDDDDKFYELLCLKCKAKLAYSCHKGKGGTLYPQRKDNKTGVVTGTPFAYLPNNGWLKWDREKKKLY